MMPFSPKLIGNPILPTIHGGLTGALPGNDSDRRHDPPARRRCAAQADRIDDQLFAARPRSGQFANVSIVKQGRRIVAFEARAWQDDANKPIASAFAHWAMRGTDWPEVPSVPTRDLMPNG
jgi:hypothetical protein